ncbi:hypothetical protein [Nocardia vermiculata]|uniref:Uncharacterized protein n=1 Tax=Nocardia vermiculata TaxID=257274 RepID=A0A846XSK1_9NOCA|nr:hypothetical protein [Nocardia vermiculata]NKY49587.1 hypothetical protein [Nocardia vermiculata]
MVHVHTHPSPLHSLRTYLHRAMARHALTFQERRNLDAAHAHPAVYTASLGSHPHW